LLAAVVCVRGLDGELLVPLFCIYNLHPAWLQMKYARLCVVNGSTLGYAVCFLLDSIECIVQSCLTVCPESVEVYHLRLVAVTAPLPT
jgi:hypothetical protein